MILVYIFGVMIARMSRMQQFYMEYMLDLKDLIISRIEQVRHIHTEQAALISVLEPITSIETEFQINRAIIRFLTSLKRKQKERVEIESAMLQEMRTLRFLTTKIIDQVYTAALGIFSFYDESFCNKSEENDHTSSDRLRQLFLRFFQKYQSKVPSKEVLKMLSHHITETTPFLLMGWVSEWSKLLFMEETQAAIGNQFARHEQQMRRLNIHHRSPVGSFSRQKSLGGPSSHSAFLPREPSTPPSLTNKESVYGLFLDELAQFYKWMPLELELDFSFIKSMKKLHPKGNQFQKEETLQKATQILVEAKNRHTRDQINQFASQCQLYMERNNNSLFKSKTFEKNIEHKNKLTSQIKEKSPRKKASPFQKFFERVKSESKEQSISSLPTEKRNSLLLCPKSNQISFQSSRQIMRKLQREKLKKEFQLPEIAPNRILSTCAPSNKSKQKNSFFEPNHSMISNYERYQRNLLKQSSIPTKSYEFKQPACKNQLQEHHPKVHLQRRLEIQENPQALRHEGEELRRNRKMMLQLLREKNRHAFLDK